MTGRVVLTPAGSGPVDPAGGGATSLPSKPVMAANGGTLDESLLAMTLVTAGDEVAWRPRASVATAVRTRVPAGTFDHVAVQILPAPLRASPTLRSPSKNSTRTIFGLIKPVATPRKKSFANAEVSIAPGTAVAVKVSVVGVVSGSGGPTAKLTVGGFTGATLTVTVPVASDPFLSRIV